MKLPQSTDRDDKRKMETLHPPARSGVQNGYVTVPREPTEAMWGGLARAIIMWTRFGRPSEKALLNHLKSVGEAVPAWLAAECRDIDHVPPKGSVAVWVYRAMVDAALALPSAQSHPDCPCKPGKCIYPKCTCPISSTECK